MHDLCSLKMFRMFTVFKNIYSTCDDIGVKPDDTDCLVVPWDNKELDNCPVVC